jgi:hypothetical protein
MTRQIDVDDGTYKVIWQSSRLTGRTPGEIVASMVKEKLDSDDGLDGSPHLESSPAATGWAESQGHEVAVYANYLRTHTEGVFDPTRETLRITTGSLAGEEFPSPSAGGIKLVETLNPGRRHANTNGWRFWIVKATGRPIDSLRRVRTR